MTEEFNLSDKSFGGFDDCFHGEDIKEFIRRLKTNFCPMCSSPFDECECKVPCFSVKWLRERIKELAGKSLI